LPFEGDLVTVEGFDSGDSNDKGFMDSAEILRGQQGGDAFQALQGGMDFFSGMDSDVIIHRFDPEDVGQFDSHVLVAHFYGDGAMEPCPGGWALHRFNGIQGLVGGFEEPLEAVGFEEVVDGVEVKSLDGILAVSGGENDIGRMTLGLGQLDTRNFGHLNVEEEQVRGIFADEGHCFQRVAGGSFQNKKGDPSDKFPDHLQGERFIIDGQTSDGHHIRIKIKDPVHKTACR